MASFGVRRREPIDDEEQSREREPLLPHYHDDTFLQRQLHQKLHTYQMLRALSKGYMPSTEQAIINLRTLLAADMLNPNNEELSDSGRALAHYSKQWLSQLIELLQHKNSLDQVQDFVWYVSKARLSLDIEHIAKRASKAKIKSDATAAYKSVQTIGSLLLTNSDVRIFANDLLIIGREIFRDTVFTLADVSQDVGKRLEPSEQDQALVRKPGEDSQSSVAQQDLNGQAGEISEAVTEGAARLVETAEESLVSKWRGGERKTLLYRLKQAVLKLRQRQDYSESVSALSALLQRYLLSHLHAVDEVAQAAQDDVDRNPATDLAVKNFYSFVSSFGDPEDWRELERRFEALVKSGRDDPHFDDLVRQIGNSVQEMFTDPAFFDKAEQRFEELRSKLKELASESSLRGEIDGFLRKFQSTFRSVLRDQHVANLGKTSDTILKIIWSDHQHNPELLTDALHVFLPQLVRLVKYIPIPRLEVSTPQIDLLLENLIIEPGKTINDSSFMPFKLRVETHNDLEIRKARFRTASAVQTIVRVKLHGISVRADEVGYWIRARPGPFRLADEGIASIHLDERGIDVELELQIGKDRLEKVVSLRHVHVRVHKLNWTLRQSRFSVFAWLLKPFLRPLVRKSIESQIASSIAESLHAANRELVYARERLRAARVSKPGDLVALFRATMARLVPSDDPDLYTRVGVSHPDKGVFEGVYTPGSVVKLWNEEAEQAPQRIREYERGGWRNEIFDVHTTMLT